MGAWGTAWGDSGSGTVVEYVAQKEATFEIQDHGEFEVTIRDYSFKGQFVEVLEIDPADKEIKIEPDQKSFYV
jgi:hypothetical protein